MQKALFSRIQDMKGASVDWKKDLALQLDIKNPAMYKKISGQLRISLDEFLTICDYYDIDFQSLTRPDTIQIVYELPFLAEKHVTQRIYMSEVIKDLHYVQGLTDLRLMISSLEIPLVYEFMFPVIPAFKNYMNSLTNWHCQSQPIHKFDLKLHAPTSGDLLTLNEALDVFLDLHTIEFWNPYTFNITLEQLIYSLRGGLFQDPNDCLIILDSLRNFLDYIVEVALHGHKYEINSQNREYRARSEMFYNEIMHTNNVILLTSCEKDILYQTIDSPNYCLSTDERITNYTKNWFEKLQAMSAPLNGANCNDRDRFFRSAESKFNSAQNTILEIINS